MVTGAARRASGAVIVMLLVAAAIVALTARGRVEADPSTAEVPLESTEPAPKESIAGSAPASGGDGTTQPSAPPGPPDMTRLLEIADEVSADGRYVRIGDVTISASPPVTRPG